VLQPPQDGSNRPESPAHGEKDEPVNRARQYQQQREKPLAFLPGLADLVIRLGFDADGQLAAAAVRQPLFQCDGVRSDGPAEPGGNILVGGTPRTGEIDGLGSGLGHANAQMPGVLQPTELLQPFGQGSSGALRLAESSFDQLQGQIDSGADFPRHRTAGVVDRKAGTDAYDQRPMGFG
jgi:hypothetical protein